MIYVNNGEILKLKDDLEVGKFYGHRKFEEGMLKDTWITIDKKSIYNPNMFTVLEDKGKYLYSVEMIDFSYEWEDIADVFYKNKLTFKLERFRDILVFEVLDQCPSITNSVEGVGFRYCASNDVEVCSKYSPNIWNDKISIGGMSERIGADAISLDSPEEAEELKQKILFALSEWAKNGYFSMDKPSDKLIPDIDGIYRI